MIKNKFIYIVFLLIFALNSKAQQIPLNNQYAINKASFIPAYSGYSGNLETFFTYRQNWVGIKGAPSTGFMNVNGALNDNMGFGITALTDKSGNFSQNFISLSYAYHLYFSNSMSLSAGISPLYYRNHLNFSTIQSYGTQIDPMLQNADQLTINAFDVGVSLAFSAAGFNAGISLPQTIGMSFKFDELGSNFGMKRHYFGFLSYNYKIDNWAFEPMAVVRSTENSPVNYGASVLVKYKNKIWTNIGYSADKSILLSVGMLSGNSLAINYSYELGMGGLSKSALGTHEISIGFLIKPAKKFKPQATVFLPRKSYDTDIEVDENLANKVAILESQLKQYQKQSKETDVDLQRQIDSLKQLLKNQPITQNNQTQNQQHWVQRVRSQNVTFGLMNDKILSSSFSELDKFAKHLRQDTSLKIKILVYTDNLFSEQVNKQLSISRAKSVANYYLTKPGIKESQIEYQGMGSVDPIADNTTPEGREKNNRVEFLLSKKIFK